MLLVFKYDTYDHNYLRKSFRFAVINSNKSKSYPQNFVCMLPANLGTVKTDSVFVQVFKENSLEQAKALLIAALKKETDSEVKTEIKRRLMLLEPKEVNQVKIQRRQYWF